MSGADSGVLKDWVYQGHTVTDEMFEKVILAGFMGFIYLITEVETGNLYVGRKLLYHSQKRKVKTKKGTYRNKRVVKESNWRDYFGSSPMLTERVLSGEYTYEREVLIFCKNKADLMYHEVREQIERNVLFDDKYMNMLIHCRTTGKGMTPFDVLKEENAKLLD